MATLNTEFYQVCEDSLYSDGSIEDEILDRVKQNDDTLQMDTRWPIFYHFSLLRQNILNWYPFHPDAPLLEIGAGCGALTGLFAQRVKSVTACELTLKRASIMYERHKHYPNLEVVVGNFLRVTFPHKYDYIVVNGVLEYAKMIMQDQSDQAFVAFLNYAKELLAPNGKILIAIENRLGLKYFSGAAEDHLGTFFSGINGYSNDESVKTFSKSELQALCDQTGLQIYRWYYPYPDYKFPTEVFTDKTINTMSPSYPDIPLDLPRAQLFQQDRVYGDLMENHVSDRFSNSFLLEVGKNPIAELPDISYVKISNNRKKVYNICTIISADQTWVQKKALYPQGIAHIRKMAQINEHPSLLYPTPVSLNKDSVCYPFVEKETLLERAQSFVQQGSTDDFWEMLRPIRDSFYSVPETVKEPESRFCQVFGCECCQTPMHWQQPMNVDLIAENLFYDNGKWQYIDNEWVFDFCIPAEFSLWRTLTQMQDRKFLVNVISEDAIKHFLNIDDEQVRIFRNWEQHFSKNYVGMQDMSVHYQPIYCVDLGDVLEQKKSAQTVLSHLFLFSEQEEPVVLNGNARLHDGAWFVCFESDKIKTASQIRWDPLEGQACKITNISINGLTIASSNAESDLEAYTFDTFDPQFFLDGDWSGMETIQIQFSCEIRDWTTGYFKREQERDSEHNLRIRAEEELTAVLLQNKALLEQQEQTAQVMQTLQMHYQNEQHENAKSFTRLEEQNYALTQECEKLQQEIQSAQMQYQDVQRKYENLQTLLREWKIFKAIRAASELES